MLREHCRMLDALTLYSTEFSQCTSVQTRQITGSKAIPLKACATQWFVSLPCGTVGGSVKEY